MRAYIDMYKRRENIPLFLPFLKRFRSKLRKLVSGFTMLPHASPNYCTYNGAVSRLALRFPQTPRPPRAILILMTDVRPPSGKGSLILKNAPARFYHLPRKQRELLITPWLPPFPTSYVLSGYVTSECVSRN